MSELQVIQKVIRDQKAATGKSPDRLAIAPERFARLREACEAVTVVKEASPELADGIMLGVTMVECGSGLDQDTVVVHVAGRMPRSVYL